MSQEPHLAESWKSRFQHKAFTISEKKSKRPGAYSGAERRQPRAKSSAAAKKCQHVGHSSWAAAGKWTFDHFVMFPTLQTLRT